MESLRKKTSGVSVGFCSRRLLKQAGTQKFKLVKCIYDREKQIQLIQKGIDHYLNDSGRNLSFNVDNDDPDEHRAMQKAVNFLGFMISLSPIIKDKGFREEAEWRLISTLDSTILDDNILFRTGPSFLIPYCIFELGSLHLAIKRVIIGPTPNPQVANYSLSVLFKKLRLDSHVKIDFTDIPYRAW